MYHVERNNTRGTLEVYYNDGFLTEFNDEFIVEESKQTDNDEVIAMTMTFLICPENYTHIPEDEKKELIKAFMDHLKEWRSV